MALIDPRSSNFLSRPWDNANIDVKDYSIGGKLVIARCIHPDDLMSLKTVPAEEIKRDLTNQLVTYIMEKGLIEFTKFPDITRMQTTYTARCYLAPNDQIRIIRSIGK